MHQPLFDFYVISLLMIWTNSLLASYIAVTDYLFLRLTSEKGWRTGSALYKKGEKKCQWYFVEKNGNSLWYIAFIKLNVIQLGFSSTFKSTPVFLSLKCAVFYLMFNMTKCIVVVHVAYLSILHHTIIQYLLVVFTCFEYILPSLLNRRPL